MMYIVSIYIILLLYSDVFGAPQSQVLGRECNQPNSEFRRCEFSTRATCLNPEPNSDEFAAHCEDGCFCLPGYYYNANSECVLLEDCDEGRETLRETNDKDSSLTSSDEEEEE